MASHKSLTDLEKYAYARSEKVRRFLGEEPISEGSLEAARRVLRTGYWFETLRRELGAPTAYAVGKHVHPEAYNRIKIHEETTTDNERSTDNGTSTSPDKSHYHHNAWAAYAQGRGHPGRKTREDAERLVPDAGLAYRHPLWEILDVSRPIADRGDALIRQLHPTIQWAIFEPGALAAQRYRRRPTLPRCLMLLESCASLDALAGMMILLREAHSQGRHPDTFEIGCSLHRIMLMVNVGAGAIDLGLAFIAYLERVVFPLTVKDGMGYDVPADRSLKQAQMLERIIQDAENSDAITPGRPSEWPQIFWAPFGMHSRFGLAPKYMVTTQDPDESLEVARHIGPYNAACDWGFDVLCKGEVEEMLPKHLIKAIAAELIYRRNNQNGGQQ